jgi:enterochelin esterase-like enzyme
VTARRRAGRTSALFVALGLIVIGFGGAYSYWESYYQHRGFQTVALVAGAHQGRLVDVNFYSRALGRKADYLAYLPPGYDPARRRYPAYYLLHGSPGRPEVYVTIANMGLRMDDLVARHRMQPMILVYPDGRIGGSTYSDSEWANTPSGAYMSYVINVVEDVDHRFAAIENRRARVIAGFSAGAYGATNIALHNLGVFGALESWSGYYLETRSGVFAHASTAVLDYNSPLHYVRTLGPALAADPLRAFLFIGRDDDSSPQTAPMARALAERGARVSYALYPGGHDWQLWHAHLDQMLILAAHDVSQAPRSGTGPARTLTPGVVPIPRGRGRRHARTTHREPAGAAA